MNQMPSAIKQQHCELNEAAAAWSVGICRWCRASFVICTWTLVYHCKAGVFVVVCRVTLASQEVVY